MNQRVLRFLANLFFKVNGYLALMLGIGARKCLKFLDRRDDNVRRLARKIKICGRYLKSRKNKTLMRARIRAIAPFLFLKAAFFICEVKIFKFIASLIMPFLVVLIYYFDAVIRWKKNFHQMQIQFPPGSHLLKIAKFIYSSKTVKEIFEPIVFDWRMDYCDALKRGEKLRCSWINVRERWNFLKAMTMRSPVGDFWETIQRLVK